MISACHHGIELRATQNGAAEGERADDRHDRDEDAAARSRGCPGRCAPTIGHGQSNGACQPPKKRATVRAETMNTFTYSAKKKNPKRMPQYSVAKPATISLSASVRSNGVRFASAVAAMKKISAAERLLEDVPVEERAGLHSRRSCSGSSSRPAGSPRRPTGSAGSRS